MFRVVRTWRRAAHLAATDRACCFCGYRDIVFYKCNFDACGKKFRNEDYLRKHVVNKHEQAFEDFKDAEQAKARFALSDPLLSECLSVGRTAVIGRRAGFGNNGQEGGRALAFCQVHDSVACVGLCNDAYLN